MIIKEIFPKLLTLVWILMIMSIFQSLGYSQTPTDCTIRGTITDINNALVPGVLITLTNKDFVRKATTSDIGEYSLTVPPGIYSVVIPSYRGFDPTYRSEIKLDANTTRSLNFKMYSKIPLLWAWAGAYAKIADHPSNEYASFSYEEIPNLSERDVRNGMVRFAEKCQTPLLIRYRGCSFGDCAEGITFTYDFFSVVADNLHINTKTKEIFALGNLEIQNDNEYIKYNGVIQISIKDGKVTYKKINQ